MITAKEARKTIEDLVNKRGGKEKKIAEEKIMKAVENSESYCFLGIVISEATENWLKSLGYQVRRVDSVKDGSDTEVKW